MALKAGEVFFEVGFQVGDMARSIGQAVGRAGQQMQRFAANLGSRFASLVGEVAKLKTDQGIFRFPELAAGVKQMADAVSELKIAIVQAFRPEINRSIQLFVTSMGQLTRLVQNNRGVALAIGALVAAIGALGTVLVVAGPAIAAFGSAIQATLLAIGFILTPIGALIAAVTAVIAAFTALATVGLTVWLNRATQGFRDLTSAAGGFVNAIAGGQLQLALQILENQFSLLWRRVSLDFIRQLAVTFVSANSILQALGVPIAQVTLSALNKITKPLQDEITALESRGAALLGRVRPLDPLPTQAAGVGGSGDFFSGTVGFFSGQDANRPIISALDSIEDAAWRIEAKVQPAEFN